MADAVDRPWPSSIALRPLHPHWNDGLSSVVRTPGWFARDAREYVAAVAAVAHAASLPVDDSTDADGEGDPAGGGGAALREAEGRLASLPRGTAISAPPRHRRISSAAAVGHGAAGVGDFLGALCRDEHRPAPGVFDEGYVDVETARMPVDARGGIRAGLFWGGGRGGDACELLGDAPGFLPLHSDAAHDDNRSVHGGDDGAGGSDAGDGWSDGGGSECSGGSGFD